MHSEPVESLSYIERIGDAANPLKSLSYLGLSHNIYYVK
jgi:hypothetical protein